MGRRITQAFAFAALLVAAAPTLAQETWARPDGGAFVEVQGPAPKARDKNHPTWPLRARLSMPTDRYIHDVRGGIPMFAQLDVSALSCGACRAGTEGRAIRLEPTLVFEDVAPRLWDVDGDGRPEIVVVESHIDKGARLVVWDYPRHDTAGSTELIRTATTDFIGQPQRWLSPAGHGDFNGDGQNEIAYVDRPHLARELVFVRKSGAKLTEIARIKGLTNHQIGDAFLSGGTRSCKGQDSLILASADWSRIMEVRLSAKGAIVTDLGPLKRKADLTRAQRCG